MLTNAVLSVARLVGVAFTVLFMAQILAGCQHKSKF